jgi:hypothetical protein
MRAEGIHRFDRDGRLRTLEHWALYAAFAHSGSGGLIKVGISQSVLKRIYDVHCGSPYPIEAALWTHVGSKRQAISAEKTIKRRLAEMRTRGEWFGVDFSDKTQKEFFHATCKAAYMRATAKPLSWNRTSIPSIREALGIKWELREEAS